MAKMSISSSAQRHIAKFEIQDPTRARFLSMEGLRGAAVILVFFVHYCTLLEPLIPATTAGAGWFIGLRELGNAGVDLFFVLSGFLIYRSCLARPLQARNYASRRIERIYPTFLVVLAIYVALMLAGVGENRIPDDFQKGAFAILQNVLLLPGILNIEPIVTVAWSLSYEAFFYIVSPCLVALLRMRRWQIQARLLFLTVLAMSILILRINDISWNFRLIMFIAGMIIHEVSLIDTKNTRFSWLADIVAVLGTVVALLMFTVLGRNRAISEGTLFDAWPAYLKFVILFFAFGYLTYRCLFTSGLAQRAFEAAPLRWLGNMSYSYYLAHSLALHIIFALIGAVGYDHVTTWNFFILLPFAFLATLILSAILFLTVERPLSLKAAFKG